MEWRWVNGLVQVILPMSLGVIVGWAVIWWSVTFKMILVCLLISSCVVCQHNGQLLSEKAEKYEMDEASDSGESNKIVFLGNLVASELVSRFLN